MLFSDIIGKSIATSLIAVLDSENRTIIVYNPYENSRKKTIIPINQGNLDCWKNTHILVKGIPISDENIERIESLVLNTNNPQIAETLATQTLKTSTSQTSETKSVIQCPKKQGRPRKEKSTITSQNQNSIPKKRGRPFGYSSKKKPIVETLNSEIDIQIHRNREIVIIEIKQTPMSIETFCCLVRNFEQYLSNRKPIQNSIYTIENSAITFQNGKQLNVDESILKLLVELCEHHKIKMT